MVLKSLTGFICAIAAVCLTAVGLYASGDFQIEYNQNTGAFPSRKLRLHSFELDAYGMMESIESGSVLVMDADTGRVIFESGGFTRRFPASVTKVMTSIIVLESVGNLDDLIYFSRGAVDLPWYAARLWMVEGETLTVRDALYGLMLTSGNELARALAEHVSGSVESFVDKMNRRAVEMGAYNTHFINPCGLPGPNQFITAYDIALILNEAVQNPVFVRIISTAYYHFPATIEYPEGRVLRNTHRMIRRTFEYEFDPRITGGKTGFTNSAQHTLVSYARLDDFNLIISVLLSPDRVTSFTDTRLLMDYAFGVLLHEREEKIRREHERLLRERELALQKQPDTGNTGLPVKYFFVTPIYMSDTEALAIAASSLGLAILSLGIIKLIYSRKD